MRNRMGSSLNLDTTVVGLQGHPISTTAPTSGQALVFDGTEWVPSDVAAGGHFVPQLDPTNDVAVSSLGGPGGGPLISAFENPVSPDADFLAIRTQRDVDGTAIFLRGPTFPDPNSANGLQMWLGDGGNLLFNFTNTGQLNLPAMPVNPMDATPRQYVDDALASLPPATVVGDTLPTSPQSGALYWDLPTAKLFLFDGTQWVVTVNTPEGGAAGPAGPPGADGAVGPAGPAGPAPTPPFNGPIIGVTDGSNAAPGQVGEYLVSQQTFGIGASGGITAVVSLSLTPGDWDVSGNAAFSWVSGNIATNILASVGIHTTSAVMPSGVFLGADGSAQLWMTGQNSNEAPTIVAGPKRYNVTAATTVYLNVQSFWAGADSLNVGGTIRARRVR